MAGGATLWLRQLFFCGSTAVHASVSATQSSYSAGGATKARSIDPSSGAGRDGLPERVPYRGWAFYRATGIARLGHGACGVVGTRSRAIRGSTIDGRVRCSASDRRCVPARPALHVSTRLLHSPPSFPVRLRLPTPLHERAFRTTLHLLWTNCAGRAGTHRRSKALKPALPSGNLPADRPGARPGARPCRGWWAFYRATGIARLGHGACGVVGTRSRAIRVRARSMVESGAAPPIVDAFRRVRRCMSRRVFCTVRRPFS